MRRAGRFATALALALLAGCGSERGGVGGILLGAAQGLITAGRDAPGAGAAGDPRAGLTPEVLDQLGQPVLLAALPARGVTGAATAVATNGPHVTWRSTDNITLSFRDGVLNATRGLGGDLMSADLDEPLAAIRGGGAGPAVRVHRYLDAENQEVVRSYVCRYEHRGARRIGLAGRVRAVREVRESCQGLEGGFDNAYWLGGDGTVWKSNQWIGPLPGMLRVELLR